MPPPLPARPDARCQIRLLLARQWRRRGRPVIANADYRPLADRYRQIIIRNWRRVMDWPEWQNGKVQLAAWRWRWAAECCDYLLPKLLRGDRLLIISVERLQ